MIFQLVYISYLKQGLHIDEEVESILKASRTNNPSLDITGMLIYRGGVFLQCLEGPEEQVKKLYQKIENDKRHEFIRSLIEIQSKERLFPDWSMGYENVDKLSLDIINKVLQWPKLVEEKEERNSLTPELITKILTDFKSEIDLVSG